MQQDRVLAEVGRLYLQNVELQDVIAAQAQRLTELEQSKDQSQQEDAPPPEE